MPCVCGLKFEEAVHCQAVIAAATPGEPAPQDGPPLPVSISSTWSSVLASRCWGVGDRASRCWGAGDRVKPALVPIVAEITAFS